MIVCWFNANHNNLLKGSMNAHDYSSFSSYFSSPYFLKCIFERGEKYNKALVEKQFILSCLGEQI